uniref:Sulfotransferase domain-containing protein n=1 Tax=Arion vulgaris TaxID=1028688 RepID=A0A0B7A5N9_9EUPU
MDAKTETVNHLEQFSKAVNMFRDRALQILVFILFRITRRLVLTLQKFTWAVTGVEGTRRDAARGLQFKQSAHVQEIFWKRKFLDHSVADPCNFITVHNGFRQPSCILKPNVSLYCMTKKEAVFIEVKESDNVYKSKHSLYLYQNQYHHAVNVITMPLASFHKMASDIGPPRVPITWMSCTARSGATLLSQMMYRIPAMLVLSEPDAITTLDFLYKNKMIQASEYKQLLASCIKLLCKPDERYSAVFVKARPSTTSVLVDIVQAFPKFRYLFMYRNSVKSIMSNLNQFQQDPAPNFLNFIMDSSILSTFVPFVRSYFYYYNVFLNEKKITSINSKKLDTVGILTAAWAASVSHCADLRYKGYNIGSILYEDFMINPRRSLSILLQRLDIRAEHLNSAAEALKVDFNKGIVHDLAMDYRRALPFESRQEADNILKAYGLSKLGERHEISGLLKLE